MGTLKDELTSKVVLTTDERLPVDEALGIHVDSPVGREDAH